MTILKSILIMAATMVAHAAMAGMVVPQVALEWRSSSNNATELSEEIEELYLALYNSGNLNLQTVEIGAPPFMEALLRSKGVMHGAHFPVSVDAMLCDLNPLVCSRRKVPAGATELLSPTTHVGGYIASRGEWRTRAGQSVSIPDYGFQQITTLVRIPAPQGWSPKDFTPDPAMDCSAWKSTCIGVVERYNPKLLKTRSDEVSITVPQLRLETTILLRRDDASEFSRQLEQILGARSSIQNPHEFNELSTASKVWVDTLSKQSPNDLTLGTIRQNLRPLGTIKKFGVGDEPLVGQQIDLFKLINHPFARFEEFGESHARPVDVLIIDFPISTGHCDLVDLKFADGAEIASPAGAADGDGTEVNNGSVTNGSAGNQSATANCAVIDQLALSDADHTAAVAGVIASKENGKGMVGINPHARLWMMGLNRNLLADEQITSLARKIKIDIPDEVRVANLSFGVRPLIVGPNDFREAVEVHGSRLLVVAAAGNEGLEMMPDNCQILPACFNKLDNVITVVGLNNNLKNPGIWQSQTAGSNSSPNFDIGAPAENVLTTVTNNRFAKKTGTSFAAPQVTATASLIFAAGEYIYGDSLGGGQIAPKVVKDRLIYSADFFSGLAGRLFAGRLNVERAINVRDAQFELFDGRRIVGQVITAPDEFVCRTPNVAQRFQKWYDVRRISWNKAKGRHFLFRHIDGELGSRLGQLDRDHSCLIRTLSAPVEVQTSTDGTPVVVSFHFKDIRDYTSPLFDE